MSRVSDVYSGEYVTAAQLQGRRATAQIVQVETEPVGQEQQLKLVLTLKNADGRMWPKRVVLNKTNSLILASAYGDETNDWAGRNIEIWAEPVQFQGRIVQGVKIQPAGALAASASNGEARATPPRPVAKPAPELNDVSFRESNIL
jgi:hypothetical protein